MTQLSIQELSHLAFQSHQAGRLREAEEFYRQILARQPQHPGALHQLGGIAYEEKNYELAIDLLIQALELKPDWPEGFCNLARALKDNGEPGEAIEFYEHTLKLKPDYVEAHIGLASAFFANGKPEQAVDAFQQAIRLRPEDCKVHDEFGFVLYGNGKAEESIAAFQRAIQLKGDFAEAHLNLGMAYLALGDFKQGWRECEWRWNLKQFTVRPSDFSTPQWKGQDLKDRTILLYVEQGFGDVIQFVRYVPLLEERGARIILASRPELKRLLGCVSEIHHLIGIDEKIPRCDFHSPLMSLPLGFNTELASIPGNVPYLSAGKYESKRWGEKLGPAEGRLRVGLVWAGAAGHQNDRNRSIPLNQLAPLAKVPGVTFYSLQKDKRLAEDCSFELIDHTAELNDFADTAGLIANLDLVICVDTSIAHLAGAMGKRVWTLLPFAPDWRWLLHREDSPWYPTMRLFRQNKPGDWTDVINRVVEALGDLAGK